MADEMVCFSYINYCCYQLMSRLSYCISKYCLSGFGQNSSVYRSPLDSFGTVIEFKPLFKKTVAASCV